jgi:hypothetical protein
VSCIEGEVDEGDVTVSPEGKGLELIQDLRKQE